MANQFVGYDNIIPLLAPVAGTTGTLTSPYMKLHNAHKASFLISFGAITSTTTTDALTITVDAASVEEGAEVQQDFRYRLSGAVGANTWGAVTSVVAATGLPMLAPTADDKMVWVELDPDAIGGGTEMLFVRFVITPAPASQMEAYVVGGCGIIEARYKQTTHISATASASS